MNPCSKNFKLCAVIGLSFKVSKMLELMKPLLFGNHDNHSTIKCFFANYCKNALKNHTISNDYNFQDSRLYEMIDLSLLISKTKFLWGWTSQILGSDKWKIGAKLENAQFPRSLKRNFNHLSLNGKNNTHSIILTPNTLSDFKIEPENLKNKQLCF